MTKYRSLHYLHTIGRMRYQWFEHELICIIDINKLNSTSHSHQPAPHHHPRMPELVVHLASFSPRKALASTFSLPFALRKSVACIYPWFLISSRPSSYSKHRRVGQPSSPMPNPLMQHPPLLPTTVTRCNGASTPPHVNTSVPDPVTLPSNCKQGRHE